MFSFHSLSSNHKLIIGLTPVLLYVLVYLISPDIIYYADALQHYFISSGIPIKRELILDHWGKPLFSLLVFPFSYLGHKGLVVFNILLSGIIIFLIQRITLKLEWPWWTAFFAAILLLAMPEYFMVTFSGLTEILFATLVILILWMTLCEHYKLAAVVAGFTLFSRPEAEIFIPLFMLFLITQKQYKALLWLPLAFIIYGIAGWCILEDFWWYFNKKPYDPDGSAYGSGELWHFVNNFPKSMGIFLTLMLLTGLFVSLFDIKKPFHTKTLFWWLLVVAPTAGVLTVHSYLWWKGIYGSAGLMRVLSTVAPLFALISIRSLSVFKNKPFTIFSIVLIATGSVYQVSQCYKSFEIPLKMDSTTTLLRFAGTELKPLLSLEDTIYAIEPFTLYWAGRNGMMDNNIVWLSKSLSKGKLKPIGTKTAFIWDTKFGPLEGRIPLGILLEEENLQLKKAWGEESDLLHFNQLYEVYYFEAGVNSGPAYRKIHTKPILYRKTSNEDVVTIPNDQIFYQLLNTSVDTLKITRAVINITSTLIYEGKEPPKDFKVIVKTFNGENTTYYSKWPEINHLAVKSSLESMNISLLLPPFINLPAGTELRVELWLRNKEPIELRDFTIQLFEVPE